MMKYAQVWHRQISPISGKILIFFCIIIFILYQFFIFAQLRAKRFTRDAQAYLKKADGLGVGAQRLIVEQAILYQRTIRLLRGAIEANPLDASTYFDYAEFFNSKMGQDEQLAKVLDLSIPGETTGEKNLSLVELARRNYVAALKLNPTNAIYHQRLGSIYEKLSNDVQAEGEFKKAVLLDSQNVSIHLYLTQYYLSRNKESEFNYHLGRVVELYKLTLIGGGPMERLGNMVRQYLESIKQEGLIK